MLIQMERAAITQFAGNTDLNAEVEICDDDGKTVYIHVSYGYHGINQFSAGYTSIFDEVTKESEDFVDDENIEDVEYIEVFEELEETKNSKYAKFYQIAERMIDDIADSHKNK